jgi:hypothetical protein
VDTDNFQEGVEMDGQWLGKYSSGSTTGFGKMPGSRLVGLLPK